MTHHLRFVAVAAVLSALVVCVPVQAQTPEIDALGERAEQGDAVAQTTLGVSYYFGRGVPQDYAEAARWSRLAAEQGVADSQILLGMIYDNGLGVPEDDAEAVHWFRLAAEQGEAFAQFTLGQRYRDGRGVPQDDAEAVRWYRLAAEQGDANAHYGLGFAYGTGQGVPQDDVQAHLWFNLAASRSTGEEREIAVQARDHAASLLTPAALNEAQRLAREWEAAHPR